ncbi:MAG: hypothetical protein ACXU8N_15420 [Telluria sp.]
MKTSILVAALLAASVCHAGERVRVDAAAPRLIGSAAKVVDGSLAVLAGAARVLADPGELRDGVRLLRLRAAGGAESATLRLSGESARALALPPETLVTVRAIEGGWMIFSAGELIAMVPGDELPLHAGTSGSQ